MILLHLEPVGEVGRATGILYTAQKKRPPTILTSVRQVISVLGSRREEAMCNEPKFTLNAGYQNDWRLLDVQFALSINLGGWLTYN